MTIDERIEKLEFLLAGHIEQAKKDYEENRRLWREQQSHIEAVWMRIERGFAQVGVCMTRAWLRCARKWRRGIRSWTNALRIWCRQSGI
jgi:hypothetical protein